MYRTITTILLLLWIVLFSTCKHEEENTGCKNYIWDLTTYPPYLSDWFDSTATLKATTLQNLLCVSDTGTNTVFKFRSHKYNNQIKLDRYSCIYTIETASGTDYSSSLYGYYLTFRMSTPEDNKAPSLTAYLKGDTSYITKDFEVVADFDTSSKIGYKKPQTFHLDSTINNSGFMPVYTTRLGETFTNVYFFKGQSSKEITSFCIAQYYGLLEFTTNKGVTWTFDYK